MRPQKIELVWVVVFVMSGVPVLVEAYRDKKSAKKREQFLRKSMRLDYDETGLFEVPIGYVTPEGEY